MESITDTTDILTVECELKLKKLLINVSHLLTLLGLSVKSCYCRGGK